MRGAAAANRLGCLPVPVGSRPERRQTLTPLTAIGLGQHAIAAAQHRTHVEAIVQSETDLGGIVQQPTDPGADVQQPSGVGSIVQQGSDVGG